MITQTKICKIIIDCTAKGFKIIGCLICLHQSDLIDANMRTRLRLALKLIKFRRKVWSHMTEILIIDTYQTLCQTSALCLSHITPNSDSNISIISVSMLHLAFHSNWSWLDRAVKWGILYIFQGCSIFEGLTEMPCDGNNQLMTGFLRNL